MRRLNSKLELNFISEQGNDPIEKTYVAYTPLENYMCIAIAESYDNEKETNSAKLAVEAVLTAFEKKPSLNRLREYIRYGNEQILLHSVRTPLKASLTVLVTDYTRMRYAVCGNTKLFVLYENLFTLASESQTTYQQMIMEDAGQKLDASQVHNLTEYLGKSKRVKPFVSKKINLTEGSNILFATSNLWGRLSEVEILDACENAKTNEEILEHLQELLLSRQDVDDQKIGSFTAAVLSIEKTFKEDVQKRKKRKRLLIMAVVLIAVLALVFVIVLCSIRAIDRKKIAAVEKSSQKGLRYLEYENYSKALEEYEKAEELAEKLSLNNWQYIEKKETLKDLVSERASLLTLMQEGEAAFLAKNYEQAKKIYTQVQKQAAYLELDTVETDAKKKLQEINLRLQIAQTVALGDMYASTEDNKEALAKYEEALMMLKQILDLATQGDVQAKIYDIRQKQKEAAQAKEEAAAEEKKAREEEAEAKEKEEAEEKQKKIDERLVKLNALIASANQALGEGRIPRAKELYQEILSAYAKLAGSGEDADKAFQDITALGQAITEAEVKAEEEAEEEKLNQAAKYTLQAKDAVKKGLKKKAKTLYEKALKVYQNMDIWDERVEEIYEAMDELEQNVSATAAPDSALDSGTGEVSKMDAATGSETNAVSVMNAVPDSKSDVVLIMNSESDVDLQTNVISDSGSNLGLQKNTVTDSGTGGGLQMSAAPDLGTDAAVQRDAA